MWALYEAVSTCTNSAGVRLAEPFRRLPSRRFYPDYYNEIKNPISLAQIKSRILKNEYVNLTQVQADLNVMFENAKAYNIPDSALYKTAVKLQRLVHNKVQDLLGPEGEDDSSNDDIVVPKRSANSTPVPGVGMDDDIEDEDDESGPGRKRGKSKGKESIGGMQTSVATVSPPKGSPTKVEEKNMKTIVFREQMKKRFMILYQTLMDYTVSTCVH